MGDICKHTIKLDGDYYAPGDPIEVSGATRDALVQSGAVEPDGAAGSELLDEEHGEAEAAPDDSEWPKQGLGGWWTLSDGSKVQGEDAAREAEAALE